jgi:hypothetical protein
MGVAQAHWMVDFMEHVNMILKWMMTGVSIVGATILALMIPSGKLT